MSAKKLWRQNLEVLKPLPMSSQAGKIGYIIAWLLGVPAWILLVVFLIRGH